MHLLSWDRWVIKYKYMYMYILPPNPGVLAPKLVFDAGEANNPPVVCVVLC